MSSGVRVPSEFAVHTVLEIILNNHSQTLNRCAAVILGRLGARISHLTQRKIKGENNLDETVKNANLGVGGLGAGWGLETMARHPATSPENQNTEHTKGMRMRMNVVRGLR